MKVCFWVVILCVLPSCWAPLCVDYSEHPPTWFTGLDHSMAAYLVITHELHTLRDSHFHITPEWADPLL